MKILIVGGGLGGMMLAAALEQRGVEYDLIEKSPRECDQGYSLGLWCNSRILFRSLGLQNEFDGLGTRIHTYDIHDHSGRLLRAFRFDLFYLRYGMAYTQINRQQLRQSISSQVDPARISYNTTFSAINRFPDHAEAKMSDGTTRRYDLIVGADGVHSHVRDLVFGNSLQTFTGWRAWYIWIDKRFRTPAGMTEFLGPGRCLGIFDDGDRALAIFFAACPPDTPDDPTARIALLKNLFQNELRSLPGALDTTRDDEVMSTDLASVRLKRWVKGRVVLLGDAAHAFEPHTGLGASMAMEDAHVLAKEISGVSRDYSVDQALGNYEKKRQERVVVALHLNRKIRTLAFLRPKPMRALANLLIPCVPERLFTKSYFELFDQNELGDGNAEETHFGSSESTAPVQSSS